jgi:tRNA G46 methylase TrmB
VILEHLTKILKDIPNPVIVELGCNNGTLSKKMADAFPTAKFILVDAGLYIYKNKPLMKARQYKGKDSRDPLQNFINFITLRTLLTLLPQDELSSLK